MATATLLENHSREDLSHCDSDETSPVDEPLYEIVNGRKVELPPMAISSIRVASLLSFSPDSAGRASGLGWVINETLHWLDDSGDLKRRPDVSFVSYDRWPRNKPITDDEAWQVVPDLAVEVVSPSDKADELLGKVEEYFAAGVVQVWVVYPRRRVVHVFESFTRITVVEPGRDLGAVRCCPDSVCR